MPLRDVNIKGDFKEKLWGSWSHEINDCDMNVLIVEPNDKECLWKVNIGRCQTTISFNLHDHNLIRINLTENEEEFTNKNTSKKEKKQFNPPFYPY